MTEAIVDFTISDVAPYEWMDPELVATADVMIRWKGSRQGRTVHLDEEGIESMIAWMQDKIENGWEGWKS